MTLSAEDRAALRAEWLGEALPEDMARLLAAEPVAETDRSRRDELAEYRRSIAREMWGRTRRLLLAYSPAAVAKLVELIQDGQPETSRKAAAELLKHFSRFVVDEAAAEATGADAESRGLVDRLTNDQGERILSILADARHGPVAPGEGETKESGEPAGN